MIGGVPTAEVRCLTMYFMYFLINKDNSSHVALGTACEIATRLLCRPTCSGAKDCSFLATAIAVTLLAAMLISGVQTSQAGSATWSAAPDSGDWNTTINWTPATVPNGPADTAAFNTSGTTTVSPSANTEVNSIVFNAGASAFTITATPTLTLTISGVGITNNSGITQNFVTAVNGAGNVGEIVFTNSATAGSLTAFTNNGSAVSGFGGGALSFNSTSTAGNGTFTNNGGVVSGAGGGTTIFFFSSTAGNGTRRSIRLPWDQCD